MEKRILDWQDDPQQVSRSISLCRLHIRLKPWKNTDVAVSSRARNNRIVSVERPPRQSEFSFSVLVISIISGAVPLSPSLSLSLSLRA